MEHQEELFFCFAYPFSWHFLNLYQLLDAWDVQLQLARPQPPNVQLCFSCITHEQKTLRFQQKGTLFFWQKMPPLCIINNAFAM
jgi:hypothetical protein